MLYEKRKNIILSLIDQKSIVTLQELVNSIGVSESTIRRDLVNLEEEKLLVRVHGGATALNHIGNEKLISERYDINQEAKSKIASYCSSLILDGMQIYIDAGTTTLEIINNLEQKKDISIVSNGLEQSRLALKKQINITILGGNIGTLTHAVRGGQSENQLNKLNFEYSFIGMNGISNDGKLTTTNIEEARLKEIAMKNSRKVFILMDNTKISKIYHHKVDIPDNATLLFNSQSIKEEPEFFNRLKDTYSFKFIED